MKKYLLAGVITIVLLSLAGCKDDSDGEITKPAREGDGRVICFNSDDSVFFDEVGSYVSTGNNGTLFRYLKHHPKYDKGLLRFSPAWRCFVDDWK